MGPPLLVRVSPVQASETRAPVAERPVDDPRSGREEYGLTPAQRETLLTALEERYFAVPRETNLVELGERMGINAARAGRRSGTAASDESGPNRK